MPPVQERAHGLLKPGSPDQHPPCRSRSFGQSSRLLGYSGAGDSSQPLPFPWELWLTQQASLLLRRPGFAPAAETRLGCGGGRDLGLASLGGPVGVRLGNDASLEPER